MSAGVGRSPAAVLFLLAGLAALPAAGQDDPALRTRIEEWVDGLGDSAWSVREAAQKKLLDAGEPAIPALKRAATDPDPETARRAREILGAILWREPPDVSPEAAEFVRGFGQSGPEERETQLTRFAVAAGKNGRPFLLRVLEHDLDPAVRRGAYYYLAFGENAAPDSEIERALGRGEDAESARLLGDFLQMRGRPAEAVSAFRLAVERDPANESHRLFFAWALFHVDRWRDALSEFEALLERYDQPIVRMDLLSGIARCRFRLGEDGAAFETVRRLVEEGPTVFERYEMAEAALRWGAHVEGLAWLYREGARNFPEFPVFPAGLGDLLYRAQDLSGAVPALEQALALSWTAEGIVLAADRLARARFEAGVPEGESLQGLVLAACVEREAGRFESSCAAWRAALSLGPDETIAREFTATLVAWDTPEARAILGELQRQDGPAGVARNGRSEGFATSGADPDRVERALSTGREADRMAAARLLGGFEEEAALRLARLALADRSASVRLACAGSLARLRPEAVRPLLVEVLRDPAWRVAFKAAGVLLAGGDRTGMEVLVAALRDPKSAVRQQALRELAGSGRPEVCEPLRALAGDPDESSRRLVIESLGRLGQASEIPVVAAALEDASSLVRSAAVDALLALGAKGEVLERAAGTARRLSIEEPLDPQHPLAWARAELALGRPAEAMAAARVAIWVQPASRDAWEFLRGTRDSLPEGDPDRTKFARIPGGWRVSSSGY